MKRKREMGFSLIELVIVVSVLAILAAVVTPQINKLVTKSKVSRLETELKTIKNALNSIYADVGFIPKDVSKNTDPGLMSSSKVPKAYRDKWEGPYLDRWPTEHPWGGSYDYNYGKKNGFNYDGTSSNEVWITISDSLTKDTLVRIDDELDDGNRKAGNFRHDNKSSGSYYVCEGPVWK